MLEFSIREVLNKTAPRRMAVLRPLKVVIENYPEGKSEELEAVNHPDDPAAGSRKITFGRELYVEQDDFMENPPKKFFRLSPGKEVRLRYAYFVTCREVVKNAAGEVVELRCTYDPATRGGNTPPDGRKVKATLHWVSAADSVPAEVRVYQSAVHQARSGCGQFRRRPQSEFARSAERRAHRAGARRRPIQTSRCSSSARAIFARTQTPRPAGSCSTARSGCAILGPRWRAGKAPEAGTPSCFEARLRRAPQHDGAFMRSVTLRCEPGAGRASLEGGRTAPDSQSTNPPVSIAPSAA